MNRESAVTLARIYPVTAHTEFVGEGSIFVAIKGAHRDGVDFIPEAIKRGAKEIVVAQGTVLPPEVLHTLQEQHISLRFVQNTRHELALLSARAAGYPAQQLRIIGITGTKGKTTTSFLLAHMLQYAGRKTALLSTIGNKILNHSFSTSLTTPQPDYLHQFFAACVKAGVTDVVMEVAAQGLSLYRTAGIAFDGALFTNFSQEHGEFYDTLHDYFHAKCMLLEHVKPGSPIILNADDPFFSTLLDQKKPYRSFSLEGKMIADWQAIRKKNDADRACIELFEQDVSYLFDCPQLLGDFNNYNMVAALTMARCLGLSYSTIAQALACFEPVPGRMQQFVLPNGARCIVDYAHTPSSYEQVLSLLATWTDHLIVVFGAGGDRDKEKRPLMGAIAAQHAQTIFLTTDNPRSENPADIVQDIYAGISPVDRHKVIIELDRATAIRKAYACATGASVIALLGKGPDEYQIVGSVKTYFSERAIIQSL
jgi:UDP-N-acetylmuramoyl-L-alanyl-D-glutamate--2,6-diaminopimelate ligase